MSSLEHVQVGVVDGIDPGREFREKGYVHLPAMLSSDEVTEVEAQLARYIDEVVPGLPEQDAFYEVKGQPETLKQMHRMLDNDSWFRDFFLQDRFLGLAEQLLGTPVVHKNMEYFAKPPRIGNPTPAHQDGYYFMIEPNEALTMWVALDEIDEENGCIRYVEGSHRKGVRPHAKSGVLGFSQGITDFGPEDEEYARPMRARPGDLLAHHSLTIHRADANRSERPRRALGLVCYSTLARHDAEKSAAYQRELAEELRAAGRI